MSRNAAWIWKQFGDLVVIVTTEGPVSDDDLEATNHLHRTNQVTKGIAVALGNPSMTASQRKKTSADMGNHRAYVVTRSAVVRGVVTAMNWLGNPMRSCAPERIEEALHDLGLPIGIGAAEILEWIERTTAQIEREKKTA